MTSNSIYQDGTYLKANPTWNEEDSSWKATNIATMLIRNHIRPLTICEIGCGAGGILDSLSNELGDKVEFSGYELSPQAFKICRKKEKRNLHFFLEDLLEKKDLFFDVVMAIDVFEHVDDYIGFLRKLRPKGTYKIFHIPLELSVQTLLHGSPLQLSRYSAGHLHYFSKETALATLIDTGYEIIDSFYTRGSLELPNRGWRASLLKLPRKLLFLVHQDSAARILGGFSLLVLAK